MKVAQPKKQLKLSKHINVNMWVPCTECVREECTMPPTRHVDTGERGCWRLR